MASNTRNLQRPRSMRRTCSALAICSVTLAAHPDLYAESTPRVAILHSHQKTCHDAAQAIQAALTQANTPCVLIQVPKGTNTTQRRQALRQLADAKPTVIATGGVRATLLAMEAHPRIPIVFFMVPNALDAPFIAKAKHTQTPLAGVATDIAPKDYADGFKDLHPACRRIAVLHSPHAKRTVQTLQAGLRPHGIQILPIDAKKDLFPKAIDVINSQPCDGVLMVPDANVYNAPNVQRLLLWGLRHKKPVWTFSANIVKAGAFAGLYADSEAIGRQAAQLITKMIAGIDAKTIGLHHPSQVRKAINLRTAERIGVPITPAIAKTMTVRYGERP
jgi:putative ABC transport system substrate-binding protein